MPSSPTRINARSRPTSQGAESVRAHSITCGRLRNARGSSRRRSRHLICGKVSRADSSPRKTQGRSPAHLALAGVLRSRGRNSWQRAWLRLTTSHEGRSASVESRPDNTRRAGGAIGPNGPDVVPANFDDTEYDAAVADLQRALKSGRGQLEPATVQVVEQNLAIIDQAVEDARRALAEDPSNADLSGYLLDTRRRKLDLLRHAAALAEDFN